MTDWIFSILDGLGSIGVGLLVLLENLVPPIPSEVILPLAGFRARDGALQPVAVWICATVGSVLGACILYALGYWVGYGRLRRLADKPWFIITSAEDLERGRQLFQRHGSWIVAVARCFPVIRSVVSLPAGIIRMPLPRFILLTALGSGVWNATFLAAGWLLADKWQQIDRYSQPIGTAVTIALAIGLAWLIWRKLHPHTSSTEETS